MENTPSRRGLPSLVRPQIFVNVEFGVSWSQRRPPNAHGLTYRSRALRDRALNFPRHVPHPATNYLDPTPPPQQRRPLGHDQQQPREDNQQALPRQVFFDTDTIPEEEERSSRDSRSSRSERGRSAPPPINNSPWDVRPSTAEGSAVAGARPQPPHIWKDLPEVPSRFRLGEDGMPWSSWSWPMGYDPDAEVDDPRPSAVLFPSRRPAPAPPAPQVETPRYSANDPSRTRELEALSAAMVTVDNGFENQWWNQGERETTATLSANMATASATPAYRRPPSPELVPAPQHHDRGMSAASLGWAIATEPTPMSRGSFPPANPFVSPIATSASSEWRSPPPSYQPLHRSMSTRSEELFFDGGRYA